MNEKTLSPSASAVYWLFRANEQELKTLRRVDLVRLSMMSEQSFDNGVRAAKAAGLISYDKARSSYGLRADAEALLASHTQK